MDRKRASLRRYRVYRDGQIAGYVFSTLDIVDAQGYSAVPFDVIAGVDLTGHISGSKVIFHREPHVYLDEIRQPQLDTFLARTAGMASQGGNSGALSPDYVAGATVTARAMRDAVFDSAQLVLIGRGLSKAKVSGQPSAPSVDVDGFKQMSWNELLAEGSIVHKVITDNDVAAALGKANAAGGKLDVPLSDPNSTYIDIYTGLATPGFHWQECARQRLRGLFRSARQKHALFPCEDICRLEGPL